MNFGDHVNVTGKKPPPSLQQRVFYPTNDSSSIQPTQPQGRYSVIYRTLEHRLDMGTYWCILIGASGSEPHTSGKARLPVVEYYEFGPRSESGIPSIRLPSWRQSPRERPSIGLGYHFERFSNSFGRFYGRKAPKRPPARPSSTGCRLSLEQGRSSNTALFSPQVSTKIWVGGENSRVSN